jgi:hypothetical protein
MYGRRMFMATKSIRDNITITDHRATRSFVDALERAESAQPPKVAPPDARRLPKSDIASFFGKGKVSEA